MREPFKLLLLIQSTSPDATHSNQLRDTEINLPWMQIVHKSISTGRWPTSFYWAQFVFEERGIISITNCTKYDLIIVSVLLLNYSVLMGLPLSTTLLRTKVQDSIRGQICPGMDPETSNIRSLIFLLLGGCQQIYNVLEDLIQANMGVVCAVYRNYLSPD